MSLGNDVVCLAAGRQPPRHRQQRFLDKVFAAAEQRWLGQVADPETALWWLWSLKEAAYKYCQRLRPDLTFRPTHYTPTTPPNVPDLTQSFAGTYLGFGELTTSQLTLDTPLGQVWGISARTPTYLMSVVVAAPDLLPTVRWGLDCIDTSERLAQSADVRRRVADRFRADYQLHNDTYLGFTKAGQNETGAGWPVILLDGHPHPCQLTLSHDGPYVAYAMLDGPTR